MVYEGAQKAACYLPPRFPAAGRDVNMGTQGVDTGNQLVAFTISRLLAHALPCHPVPSSQFCCEVLRAAEHRVTHYTVTT